ncbi:hypothetical protein INS49_002645 [Diaporthe citri]|uniref:uncharacterized protein n=1 Tax=Diaporthe citri TaxID=83186 RepID=UPI001C814402|nr:uncharacterized protein INS49_002645 [Diaporthe citri]KAG6368438.1 hypothetical protein INS49_002645 [Diaporthe citri]
MDTPSTVESMREEQDFIRRLYSAAHSLSCDDPDCPWADLLNESSNLDASPRQDALLLVLLGIVDNISECLDLIRILLASRDDTNRPEHFTQPTTSWVPGSSTPSHSQSEGTTITAHGPLREPPIPSLYHDQWARSPAVSPPAYTAFWHSRPQSFPRAPAPSPATRDSETTTPTGGTPAPEDQDGVGCGNLDDQHQTGTQTEPFIHAPRTTQSSADTPCRRCSPTGGNDSDHQPRGRFAARVDSDSEVGE